MTKLICGLAASSMLMAMSAFANIDLKGDLSGVWHIEGRGFKQKGPSTLVIRKTDREEEVERGVKTPVYTVERKSGDWLGKELMIGSDRGQLYLFWGFPYGNQIKWEGTLILNVMGDSLTLGGDNERRPLGTMIRVSTNTSR